MSATAQISPQWVAQVLRDRGISPPAILTIQRFLNSLSAPDRADVMAALRKIEYGVDEPAATRALVDRMGQDLQAMAVAGRPEEGRSATPPASPPASPKPRPKKNTTDADPWYRAHGVHIYASSAAMKVELDVLKSEPGEPIRYTVQVEIAAAKAANAYDWEHKISFQFTRRELPLLAATLMGYTSKPLNLSNHGPDRDKSLDIEGHNLDRLFIRMRQAGRRIAMPVFAEDVHAWLTIAMQALKHNTPELDGTVLLAMLKRTAAIHDAPTEGKGEGRA